LGDIPVLGNLFSSTTTDIVSTEVILTLSPHVVRNVTMPAVEGQAFWSGTELTYATTPLYSTVAVSYASNKAGERSSLRLPAETIGAPGADSVPAHPIPDAPAVVITVGTPSLQPSELGAFVGQEFWVELNTQGLTGLTQSTVMLIYDPTVLEFKRAEAGALLLGDGNSGSGTIPGPPPTGRVALHLQRSGIPSGGNGALNRVLFLARSPGDSAVDILSSPGFGHWTRVGHGLIHVR
jgi:general secretion pathway protein D